MELIDESDDQAVAVMLDQEDTGALLFQLLQIPDIQIGIIEYDRICFTDWKYYTTVYEMDDGLTYFDIYPVYDLDDLSVLSPSADILLFKDEEIAEIIDACEGSTNQFRVFTFNVSDNSNVEYSSCATDANTQYTYVDDRLLYNQICHVVSSIIKKLKQDL